MMPKYVCPNPGAWSTFGIRERLDAAHGAMRESPVRNQVEFRYVEVKEKYELRDGDSVSGVGVVIHTEHVTVNWSDLESKTASRTLECISRIRQGVLVHAVELHSGVNVTYDQLLSAVIAVRARLGGDDAWVVLENRPNHKLCDGVTMKEFLEHAGKKGVGPSQKLGLSLDVHELFAQCPERSRFLEQLKVLLRLMPKFIHIYGRDHHTEPKLDDPSYTLPWPDVFDLLRQAVERGLDTAILPEVLDPGKIKPTVEFCQRGLRNEF